MATFWRIAAYTFLALSGMYAWLSIPSGWRHYLGLGIFFFASVRIMVLLFPRKHKDENKSNGSGKGVQGSDSKNPRKQAP
jgi:hypothetical protein